MRYLKANQFLLQTAHPFRLECNLNSWYSSYFSIFSCRCCPASLSFSKWRIVRVIMSGYWRRRLCRSYLCLHRVLEILILMHKSTHVHCTQAKDSARRMSLCDTEHHFAHRRDKSKNTRSSDSTLNAADMQRHSPYPISNETTATASTTTTKSDSNACVCLAQWIWVRVGRDHNSMRELTTTSRPSVHTRSERDVQNILSYSAYCQLPHNHHSLCFIDKKQQTLNRIWKWNNEAHDNIVTQTLTHSPIVEWKHWRKK